MTMNHDTLREAISTLLVRNAMPTRQSAINELMHLIESSNREAYAQGVADTVYKGIEQDTKEIEREAVRKALQKVRESLVDPTSEHTE
jgi:geranylgeranyl pyrophosphate synthase